jgi:hypothetical protein
MNGKGIEKVELVDVGGSTEEIPVFEFLEMICFELPNEYGINNEDITFGMYFDGLRISPDFWVEEETEETDKIEERLHNYITDLNNSIKYINIGITPEFTL